MSGKGIFAKHLTAAGWRFKRGRGDNRQGTRSHSPRILQADNLKRKRERLEAIARYWIRQQKVGVS